MLHFTENFLSFCSINFTALATTYSTLLDSIIPHFNSVSFPLKNFLILCWKFLFILWVSAPCYARQPTWLVTCQRQHLQQWHDTPGAGKSSLFLRHRGNPLGSCCFIPSTSRHGSCLGSAAHCATIGTSSLPVNCSDRRASSQLGRIAQFLGFPTYVQQVSFACFGSLLSSNSILSVFCLLQTLFLVLGVSHCF